MDTVLRFNVLWGPHNVLIQQNHTHHVAHYHSPGATELHAVFEEAELQYMYTNNLSCGMNTIRRKLLARFEEK